MPDNAYKGTNSIKAFAGRLKELRSALDYTQAEMAYALGILLPRYNKYEIGRSQPPFEILIRIANLTGVDLDYLIAGQMGRRGRRRESPADQLRELLKVIPTTAVIFDQLGCLFACNDRYREYFFPEFPHFPKPGMHLAALARAWGNAHGFDANAIESFIKTRMNPRLFRDSPVELSIGRKRLHLTESMIAGYRLTLITDVTNLRSLPIAK